jgi:hypothetical protein
MSSKSSTTSNKKNKTSKKGGSSIINNGLMTNIWGPPSWKFLHCVTFGYPVDPDLDKKNEYKQFFTLVGGILPCGACRESYKSFIKDGDTELTDEVMKNRTTLSEWLYKIHNRVNDKLDNSYGVSFKNVQDRFESYRAGNINSQCGGTAKIKKIKRKKYKLVK